MGEAGRSGGKEDGKDEDKDTRTTILDAAEGLFAEHGITAVPNRALLKASGQRNESALQYHFGSREGLLRALHERRMAQLEQRRAPRVQALRASEGPLPIRALVRVQLATLFELARHEPGFVEYLKIVGEVVFRPQAELAQFLSRFDLASHKDLSQRAIEGLAPLSRATIARRMDLGRRYILVALARWARQVGRFEGADADAFGSDLLDTVSALLSAPESGERLLPDE